MSDEQREHPTANDPWGAPLDAIHDDRKEPLLLLFEQQRAWSELPEADRKGQASHFQGVHLTGAEVFWLALLARGSTTPGSDLLEVERALRAADSDLLARLELNLSAMHLEGANLYDAHLEGASLNGAHLEGANLYDAHLERASLTAARLEGAILIDARLEGAHLTDAHLERANLTDAHLERAHLNRARLEQARLTAAHLEGAHLTNAHLEGAHLTAAHLEGANLTNAHLEGANLTNAHLEGANLTNASLDKASRLNGAQLAGVSLDQVVFDNTNLSVVEWGTVQRLGDETRARKATSVSEKVDAYHTAARAYRALAVTLRAQGLASDATRFHYRAELMARYEQLFTVFARLRSRRFYTSPAPLGRWLFSWVLGTFAGYGDKLGRLFLTYLVVVSAFAVLMFAVAGRVASADSVRDVFVLSITSFHGRGVQPPGLPITDALATLTAVEAFFGLAIEGIFIAAFTRRVTGN